MTSTIPTLKSTQSARRESTVSSRPPSPWLELGLVAGPLFLAASLIQALLRPGFDLAHNAASLLSLGQFGWIQDLNFAAAGVLSLCGAIGVRRSLAGTTGGPWIPRPARCRRCWPECSSALSPGPEWWFPSRDPPRGFGHQRLARRGAPGLRVCRLPGPSCRLLRVRPSLQPLWRPQMGNSVTCCGDSLRPRPHDVGRSRRSRDSLHRGLDRLARRDGLHPPCSPFRTDDSTHHAHRAQRIAAPTRRNERRIECRHLRSKKCSRQTVRRSRTDETVRVLLSCSSTEHFALAPWGPATPLLPFCIRNSRRSPMTGAGGGTAGTARRMSRGERSRTSPPSSTQPAIRVSYLGTLRGQSSPSRRLAPVSRSPV